jgi:acetyl-CoA carboxylase biotin carboxylase subunit
MKRIFIANRGEIAVRIIRACRELGLNSVVGFSEADRSSLAVRLADEAYLLGPAVPSASYLNVERLIQVVQESKCDAVHPGYGFLSERAEFARACENAGIIFIGPTSGVIDLMGDKTRARKAAQAAGTPVVPGSMDDLRDLAEAAHLANEFGYPVMIKAAAGGGGKGLREANNPVELEEGFRLAKSEAESAFGDSSVYIEKKILNPHHVEVQLLADHHGNVIHLGERECSIQRRHQKVIEETPSPFIDEETRRKMCGSAVQTAKKIGYTNAGTIEFLVDADQNFYFLEMNTRLQVEHPITEMVTGIDIVKEQMAIAAGKPLSIDQSAVQNKGAAIECRIYAEDPENQFMPSPGKIKTLRIPGGPGIRDDTGIYEGYEVPIHYDPLLAKLIAWAPTRSEAIERMSRALEEYRIYDIKTTIPFYERVMKHPIFRKGTITTSFIDEIFATADKSRLHPNLEIAIAAAAIFEFERLTSTTHPDSPPAAKSSNWRSIAKIEGLRS